MPKGKGYKDDPMSSGNLKIRPPTKKEKAAGKKSKSKARGKKKK
jgi:hypothetical protein